MGLPWAALVVSVILLYSANAWVSNAPPLCAPSSFSKLSAISTCTGDDGDEIDDEDEFFESVSDAEALLACRAHLQRRNLLGMWVQGEQRKEERKMAMEQAAQSSSSSSSSVGFFWENPEELVFFDRRKRPRFLNISDSSAWDTENEYEHQYQPIVVDIDEEQLGGPSLDVSDYGSNSLSSWEYSQWIPKVDNDDNMYIEDESLEFYDEEAHLSHKKMSEAKKRFFSDPEWKKGWYNRRWGSHTKKTDEELRQRRFNERVRSEPLKDFLAHPALCKLDEATIAKAMKTYRTSNEKRSKSLQQAYQDRKVSQPESDEKLPRDSLYKMDEEALAEKRRQRSEAARLAYQTRLDNRPQQNRKRKSRKQTKRLAALTSSRDESQQHIDDLLSSEPDSPQGSLRRILGLLDADALSVTSNSTLTSALERDLEVVSQPKKLSGRKGLYRRILNDVFGLRGKCVPADSGTTFVTQSTIPDLHRFVKQNLERVRKDLGTS